MMAPPRSQLHRGGGRKSCSRRQLVSPGLSFCLFVLVSPGPSLPTVTIAIVVITTVIKTIAHFSVPRCNLLSLPRSQVPCPSAPSPTRTPRQRERWLTIASS